MRSKVRRGTPCDGPMAKPKPAKKREKPESGQPQLPGMGESAPADTTRVLPMQLRIGDRLKDEIGEYEVVARPYTTAGGKTANVRVKRVESDAQMVRVYGAHEKVTAKRTGAA